jgi:hypothetical protein
MTVFSFRCSVFSEFAIPMSVAFSIAEQLSRFSLIVGLREDVASVFSFQHWHFDDSGSRIRPLSTVALKTENQPHSRAGAQMRANHRHKCTSRN